MVAEGKPHREKQVFDHYLNLRHKVLNTENLKLAETLNPPPDTNNTGHYIILTQ